MKQIDKKGEKNMIGAFGEQIAVNYVKKLGFTVLDRNYLKKCGEIDVVACETIKNKHILHFVEVKAVSYETRQLLEQAVSHGTWRPEENVTPKKVAKKSDDKNDEEHRVWYVATTRARNNLYKLKGKKRSNEYKF